jgi:hypothetical protein
VEIAEGAETDWLAGKIRKSEADGHYEFWAGQAEGSAKVGVFVCLSED